MHIFYPGDAFGRLMQSSNPMKRPWAQALDDVVVSSMGMLTYTANETWNTTD